MASIVHQRAGWPAYLMDSILQECYDERGEQENQQPGAETLFRIVRIPFKVAIVSGNLKLRLHVTQSSKTGEVSQSCMQACCL